MLRKTSVVAIWVMAVSILVFGVAGVAVAQDSTATDKWCSGVNIVFFPGGSPGGSFETVVYNGAVQATADLGPTTQYVWSDWQPDKMVTQLQQAIATKPDGIAIMGHPGDEAYKPLVDEAEAQGIIITSQNTQLPQLEAEYTGNGFGYAGATLYTQGSRSVMKRSRFTTCKPATKCSFGGCSPSRGVDSALRA